MPSRLKRYQREGDIHFLTFSCYRRRPFLRNRRSCALFLEVLETLRQQHSFLLFGYVLMPEHVHLLLTEPKLQRLGDTLRVLKGQTSRLLKGSRPQFWQTRYYDFNVFTQDRFVDKLRYIHRNPVARGLVKTPEDYPWSSFRDWATGGHGLVEVESRWTWDERERSRSRG